MRSRWVGHSPITAPNTLEFFLIIRSLMSSYAVVPAAGVSRRMGCAKLLLPWRDATVIESVLGGWSRSRIDGVVVVVRSDDHELQGICAAMDVELCVPAQPPGEMKESVALGLEHVRQRWNPTPGDAWLLAPADYPRLSAHVVDSLLSAQQNETGKIIVPTLNGRRGHPVLFPWPLAGETASLGENEGVNALLLRHPVRELRCDDPTVLDDLDTPSDYAKLLGGGPS